MTVSAHRRPTRHGTDARAASRTGIAAFAVERIRSSPVLQACALLSFVEYGALVLLAIFGERLRPNLWGGGKGFQMAGWLALCSFGSWFFIFAWFPFLRRLQAAESADLRTGESGGSSAWMGRILEGFAIACVAVVHGMMAWILVLAVR